MGSLTLCPLYGLNAPGAREIYTLLTLSPLTGPYLQGIINNNSEVILLGFLQRFLYGRYGGDHLGRALIAAYLVLYCLALLTRWAPLTWIAFLLAFWCIFRMLSRNTAKRRRENEKYLALTAPLRGWLRRRHMIRTDKDHRYFKCPNCGQQLRVPRVDGKIKITCRACGTVFEENAK